MLFRFVGPERRVIGTGGDESGLYMSSELSGEVRANGSQRITSPGVLLIRGCPRSGTSVVAEIIHSSSTAAIIFDYAIGSLVRTLKPILSYARSILPTLRIIDEAQHTSSSGSYSNPIANRQYYFPRPENFAAIVVAVFEATFGRRGVMLIGSKTPSFVASGDYTTLEPWFENISYLFLIRNPEKTINSMINRRNRSREGFDDWPWSSVESCIAEYRNNICLLISHAYAFPESCFVLKYEDLVANFEATVRWLSKTFNVAMNHLYERPNVASELFPLPPETRDVFTQEERAAVECEFQSPLRAWAGWELTGRAIDMIPQLVSCLKPLDPKQSHTFEYASADQERFALGMGWSTIAPQGVWTDGSAADLIWTFNANAEYRVALDAEFFLPPAAATLDFAIELNGHCVLEGTVFSEAAPPQADVAAGVSHFIGSSQRIDLGLMCALAGAIQRLTIRIENPRSPLEFGISLDDRSLGLLLQRFSLKPSVSVGSLDRSI